MISKPVIVEAFGKRVDARQGYIDITRAECEESFAEFVRQAWETIEPGSEYIHNWHIDLIAESLLTITHEGELDDGSFYNRLMIAVPPGSMKSLLVNVFWPAFEWGPCYKPHLRYICVSHSQELAIRDGIKMRRLIESEWFRDRWPHVVLQRDQNQKQKFENTAMGFRQCCAINSITGARADRIICDDILSVSDAASQQIKDTTNQQFFEAIPTRLVNPKRSAIIIIQQRLAEDDIIGSVLDRGLPYDYISLPMRFDPSRAQPTMLGLEDKRTEEGELLFPARFPEDVVERDEIIMGPWAAAAQFQQMPSPRGGGVIRREWIPEWTRPTYPQFDYVIAAIDTAYTTKTSNDPSAMTVWGVWSGGEGMAQANRVPAYDGSITSLDRQYREDRPKVMLMYAWAERLELHELVEKVQETMDNYGVLKLLVENKASGYSVAQELRRMYGHEEFAVQLIDPKGVDKLSRLYSVQHLFAEGIIHMPNTTWADMVINQLSVFPKGKHDDLVDTTSMALKHLRDIGLLVRGAEYTAQLDQSRLHVSSNDEPLYPI